MASLLEKDYSVDGDGVRLIFAIMINILLNEPELQIPSGLRLCPNGSKILYQWGSGANSRPSPPDRMASSCWSVRTSTKIEFCQAAHMNEPTRRNWRLVGEAHMERRSIEGNMW
jgi:hypothetical protein